MFWIEKYFNIKFFIVLNLLIIFLTEVVGGGALFYKYGILDIIAVGFVALVIARVYFYHQIFDPILTRFIQACTAAMLIFEASHVIQFIGMMYMGESMDLVFANVANMYLIGLLLIAGGAEMFLKDADRHSKTILRLIAAALTGLVVFVIVILLNGVAISLEVTSFEPFIYAAAIIGVGLFTFFKARNIKKHVDFTVGFVNYVCASILLMALAILPDIFYEFLIDLFKMTEIQAVYLSHFTFFAAISLFFLSFAKLTHLGGMLDEVKLELETK